MQLADKLVPDVDEHRQYFIISMVRFVDFM